MKLKKIIFFLFYILMYTLRNIFGFLKKLCKLLEFITFINIKRNFLRKKGIFLINLHESAYYLLNADS